MKKKILITLLALVLLVNFNIYVYAEEQNPEVIIGIDLDSGKKFFTWGQIYELREKRNNLIKEGNKPEDFLTEEELDILRKADIKEMWDKAVSIHIDKNVDQLTTSYLLGEFETGKILESNNVDNMVAIASTTKILSTYVVLDAIKAGKLSYDDLVKVDRRTSLIGGSSYDLKEDEEVTVRELIEAAMIVSGNDAINALAKHLAGSEEDFVEMMKQKLEELGITKYVVINCSGLPNYVINQQNMLTTRELFKLTCHFLKDYPEVLEITKKPYLEVPERKYREINTNPILGELPEIDGLKTGYTGMAGRCMVATGVQLSDGIKTEDMRLIGISMGSESDSARYVAIKKLMEAAFSNYTKEKLVDPMEPIETVECQNMEPSEVNIYPSDKFEIIKRQDSLLTKDVNIMEINSPKKAGDLVGNIVYYLDGEEIHRSDLIVKTDIIEASIIKKLEILYKKLFISTYKVFNE